MDKRSFLIWRMEQIFKELLDKAMEYRFKILK